MIKQMWINYIKVNPTNNPGEYKALRTAFYAGADAMQDHQIHRERLANDWDKTLELVVDNSTADLFDWDTEKMENNTKPGNIDRRFVPAPDKMETDTPGNIDPRFDREEP